MIDGGQIPAEVLVRDFAACSIVLTVEEVTMAS